jgi:CBS-domain-containing membrane protein
MNTRTKLLIQRDGENPLVIHPSAEGADLRLVRDVMSDDYSYCYVDDPYELTVQRMQERGLTWLPVLDGRRKIVGIVNLPPHESKSDPSVDGRPGTAP